MSKLTIKISFTLSIYKTARVSTAESDAFVVSMSVDAARLKKEPDCELRAETTGLITDQVRVKEELLCEASCVDAYELYADHVVKDELVLGPERPHRPHVGLTSRCWTPAVPDVGLRETPQSVRGASWPVLTDCFVRLERLLPETNDLGVKNTIRPKRNTLNHIKVHCMASNKPSTKKPKLNVKTKLIKKQKITKKQSFICDTCGKVCKFKHTLIQHFRYHLPDTVENLQPSNIGHKPYSCEICEKDLACLTSLKRHLNIHAGKKRHSCEVCGKMFLESTCFKRHKLIHSKDKPEYPCNICNKILTTPSSLKVHKRNVHIGLKLYSCELCEKKYQTADCLRKHKLSHSEELPYICDICDKKFRSIDRLRFHKRIHLNEKPYSCENCNKRFRLADTLTKHKRIHTNDKPYICKTCNKMFKAETELEKHNNMYKNPYKCVCNKLYCEFRNFKKHKFRMHGGDKMKFFCEICRKDFKSSDELNDHKQTHKGYSCGLCQHNFVDNISLQKHKKTHAQKLRYSCEKCEMKFKNWRDLFEHGSTHENN